MKKHPEKPTIPEFTSYAEEAAFWDSHDFGDYWDDAKPVDVQYAKGLSANLTVRLSEEAVARLRHRAEQVGVGPSTLARIFILRQLREEEHVKDAG